METAGAFTATQLVQVENLVDETLKDTKIIIIPPIPSNPVKVPARLLYKIWKNNQRVYETKFGDPMAACFHTARQYNFRSWLNAWQKNRLVRLDGPGNPMINSFDAHARSNFASRIWPVLEMMIKMQTPHPIPYIKRAVTAGADHYKMTEMIEEHNKTCCDYICKSQMAVSYSSKDIIPGQKAIIMKEIQLYTRY